MCLYCLYNVSGACICDDKDEFQIKYAKCLLGLRSQIYTKFVNFTWLRNIDKDANRICRLFCSLSPLFFTGHHVLLPAAVAVSLRFLINTI